MRTLFCVSLIALACLSKAKATVFTVCNMPYSPGMYTTFDAAYAVASDGDTIYMHGSNFSYGSASIYKPLVVIGTGHNPNKMNALTSDFADIIVFNANVQLIGLVINHLACYAPDGAIKKCRLRGGSGQYPLHIAGVSGWIVEGNIIEDPDSFTCIYFGFQASDNLVVQNNIFVSRGWKIYGLGNNSSQRSYFLNNVFVGDGGNYSCYDIHYANIDNNIFYGSSPNGGGLSNCLVNNNISFNCADNAFSQPGANNLENVDPMFTSYSGTLPFSYNDDFRLNPASPGHNTGTDGTDRGVFGGIGFRFTTTGEPPIAEVTAFTITSPTTVPPGGTLNISITSKRAH